MSELDRFSSVATRLISSVTKYAEEVAVKFGGKERSDVEATLRQAKAIGELTVLMSTAKVKELLSNLTPEPTADVPESTDAVVEEAVQLNSPLPDYDSLTAAQIVALMATLSSEERAVIVEYEIQNRRRATILKAVGR